MLIPQIPHRVQELEVDGKKLVAQWLRKLRDPIGKAAIVARMRRIEITGNFGNYRYLSDGVFELKIDVGPGYRLYFGIENKKIVILVFGGDKHSQDRDIEKAKKLWSDR